MDKAHAIKLLGGTPKKAADAMGYRAVQTIYLWPDPLPQATADRVMGVASRISKNRKRRPASKKAIQGPALPPTSTKEVGNG